VASDPVGALRRECSELLRFCQDLSDADWQTQSAAAGWRVQDVVANMGSAYRALFGPAALELMRSNDNERTNDVLVDERCDRPPSRAIAEYERGTHRAGWRAHAVSVGGDTDYGARFLDPVNVV
jgi:uncharacterized protein (TIGR03083 family)